MANLESASTHLQQAWNIRMAIPFHRIRAAVRCLKLLAVQYKVDIATQLGEERHGSAAHREY